MSTQVGGDLGDLASLPVPVLILLGVIVVAQLGLQVVALLKLLRTPDDRLVFGKKWPWLLIILFGEIIGAVVFLALGRTKPAATDLRDADAEANAGARATRAADVLYGPRDGDDAS